MSGTAILVTLGIVMFTALVGIFTNWIGPKPSKLSDPALWSVLVVAILAIAVLTVYQGGAFGHSHGSNPTVPSAPDGSTTTPLPDTGHKTPSPSPNTPTPSSQAGSTGPAISHPTAHSNPSAVSVPASVSVSPGSFENLGKIVRLSVTVQASANATIEAETVGLDVPVQSGDCPALKPDPCDIQFSGGTYGATDSSGMLIFTIPWYPGDACNYSGTGNEFTYPKGTFNFSIDVKDDNTGLVSSADISVTNGSDTPADASSC